MKAWRKKSFALPTAAPVRNLAARDQEVAKHINGGISRKKIKVRWVYY
jgi:hypothetical protein